MLVASNDQVAAYTANENIQNHFIYLAVINSIFTDVSSMIEQVEHHYNNAIDELKMRHLFLATKLKQTTLSKCNLQTKSTGIIYHFCAYS